MDKKIILASQSPRRRELLALLEMPFQVVAPKVDEVFVEGEDLQKQIRQIAKEKAQAVFQDHQDGIVISADTIVVLDDKILGKPKNQDEAVEMLQALSNRKHQVWTAVHMQSNRHEESCLVISDVSFYELEDKEILAYVKTGESMDKAGAYNIQGKASLFINKIQGDHFAIMGLPIAKVYQLLKKNRW